MGLGMFKWYVVCHRKVCPSGMWYIQEGYVLAHMSMGFEENSLFVLPEALRLELYCQIGPSLKHSDSVH